ncbi:MAG: helix-turn-helix domain-containing protein [Actinobacteria bacterium]|nr:helix-turn-helix domain-containing protein [Actinomycetota bacterium]
MDLGSDGEAAQLLRRARSLSRLTQSELARRAGVPQSVISAYESGRRQPSVPMLRRLVEASGQDLTVQVVATRPLGLPDTARGHVLRRHRSAVCSVAARHGGTNVRVFGSVARGDDEQNSDIDLVVDLPVTTSLLDLNALRRELTELLDTPVDVVPARSLRPEIAVTVEQEAIPL